MDMLGITMGAQKHMFTCIKPPLKLDLEILHYCTKTARKLARAMGWKKSSIGNQDPSVCYPFEWGLKSLLYMAQGPQLKTQLKNWSIIMDISRFPAISNLKLSCRTISIIPNTEDPMGNNLY